MTAPLVTSSQTPASPTPDRVRRRREVLAPLLAMSTHLRPQRRLFVEVVVVAWAALVTGVAVAVLSVHAATAVVTGDPAATRIMALAVAVLALGVLSWTEQWTAHVLAYRVIDTIRLAVHRAIGRLAPLGLGRRRSGETVAAAMSDTESLEWFYAHTAAQVLAGTAAALTVSTVGVLWFGPVGLVVLVAQLIVLAVPVLLLPYATRQGTALRHAVADLSAVAAEARASARETLLLDRVSAVLSEIAGGTARVQRVRRALALRTGAEQALVEAVGAAAVLTTLVVAAARVDAGALAAEHLPVVIVLAGAGLAPVLAVVAGLQRLGETSAAAARVDGLLTSPGARPPDGPDADVHGSPEDVGRIQVCDLRVVYPGTTRAVLDGLDLDIRPGEHVALVGTSGAGKTTLALALARLIGIDSGELRIDGVRAPDEPGDRTRRRLVLVGQHAHVFRASVRENLLDPEASDDRLWSALEQARVADHVRELPHGLDTVLAEHGATWSGGERQRLGLARGLLRDPSVLVLDEPTAGLDTRTESDVLGTLAAARRGRTTLVITHRPAVMQACQRVVLIDGGRIVAEGTHESLISGCTRYREVLATPAETGSDEQGEEVTTHG